MLAPEALQIPDEQLVHQLLRRGPRYSLRRCRRLKLCRSLFCSPQGIFCGDPMTGLIEGHVASHEDKAD